MCDIRVAIACGIRDGQIGGDKREPARKAPRPYEHISRSMHVLSLMATLHHRHCGRLATRRKNVTKWRFTMPTTGY